MSEDPLKDFSEVIPGKIQPQSAALDLQSVRSLECIYVSLSHSKFINLEMEN